MMSQCKQICRRKLFSILGNRFNGKSSRVDRLDSFGVALNDFFSRTKAYPISINRNNSTAIESSKENLDNAWDSLKFDRFQRLGSRQLSHKALLVDAAGTLLEPKQAVTQVYLDIGKKYGVKYDEKEILERYRWAYSQPWRKSFLRYVDDGRPFWQFIVSEASGCSDPNYFEELYHYYTTANAWKISDPSAEPVFRALRKAGVKIAVVSNFDTRLRPLLRDLKCDTWFDAIAVSAEVKAEKPNPVLFLRACELLDTEPKDALHIGDDRRNDVWGARDAGCDAYLWGDDVHSFKEVAELMGLSMDD